jgi:outer membrane murein-binding lipoprotein Lpp
MAVSSQAAQPTSGRMYVLGAVIGLVLLMLAGAYLFFSSQQRVLDQLRAENTGLQSQVTQLQTEANEAKASAAAANDKMAKARLRVEVLDDVMRLGRAAAANRGQPVTQEQRAAAVQFMQKAGTLNDPVVNRLMTQVGDPNARAAGEEFLLHMMSSLREELR